MVALGLSGGVKARWRVMLFVDVGRRCWGLSVEGVWSGVVGVRVTDLRGVVRSEALCYYICH